MGPALLVWLWWERARRRWRGKEKGLRKGGGSPPSQLVISRSSSSSCTPSLASYCLAYTEDSRRRSPRARTMVGLANGGHDRRYSTRTRQIMKLPNFGSTILPIRKKKRIKADARSPINVQNSGIAPRQSIGFGGCHSMHYYIIANKRKFRHRKQKRKKAFNSSSI